MEYKTKLHHYGQISPLFSQKWGQEEIRTHLQLHQAVRRKIMLVQCWILSLLSFTVIAMKWVIGDSGELLVSVAKPLL